LSEAVKTLGRENTWWYIIDCISSFIPIFPPIQSQWTHFIEFSRSVEKSAAQSILTERSEKVFGVCWAPILQGNREILVFYYFDSTEQILQFY